MKISEIKGEDIEKLVAILSGLASLGFKLHQLIMKYKADNPDMSIEDFISEALRIKEIPTTWDTVYPETEE